MQGNNWGSSSWITIQILIIYSVFLKPWRKNRNKIKQCIGSLKTSRKFMIGGGFCKIFSLSLYPHENGKAIKYVSEWNLQQSPGRQGFV